MLLPCITLTTDFGLRDHYVAAMKGVIYRLAPGAAIADITHAIPPQDIPEAAYTLAQAHAWFPAGTIHVVVVDPGVGTARRALLATAGGHFFVAPDNGVLSPALERAAGPVEVRHCTADRFWLPQPSSTFHGRDIFAPMAAWLARGAAAAEFGPPIDDYLRLELPRPRREGSRVFGAILHQDGFGNLITNLTPRDLDWTLAAPRRWRGQAGRAPIRELRGCYAGAPAGSVFAIWGSSGWLELSSSGQSAAELTGLVRGEELQFELCPGGGGAAGGTG